MVKANHTTSYQFCARYKVISDQEGLNNFYEVKGLVLHKKSKTFQNDRKKTTFYFFGSVEECGQGYKAACPGLIHIIFYKYLFFFFWSKPSVSPKLSTKGLITVAAGG